jgi:hypothetical protein
MMYRCPSNIAGYCEVKISESSSNSVDIYNDMLRLAKYGKRLCDKEDLNGTLLVMTVGKFFIKHAILFSVYSPHQTLFRNKGFKLTFYMMVMQNNTFYTVFEFYCIDIPRSLYYLPSFMANVHKMNRVLYAYRNHCVKRPSESPKRGRSRSMSKEEYKQIINASKPKKKKKRRRLH